MADRLTHFPASGPRRWRFGRRIAALEQRVAGLACELRTARLVVGGPDGTERIVAEVREGTAELVVGLGDRTPRRSGVVLFASPAGPGTDAGTGLQVWAEGDQRAEVASWSGPISWRTGLFLDRAPPATPDEPMPTGRRDGPV